LAVELAVAALPVADTDPDADPEADPGADPEADPEADPDADPNVDLAVDPVVVEEPLRPVVEALLDPVFELELAEDEIVMVTPFARQLEE